jgi:hypothetical protein
MVHLVITPSQVGMKQRFEPSILVLEKGEADYCGMELGALKVAA